MKTNHGKDKGLDVLSMEMENTVEYLSILKNYVDRILRICLYDFMQWQISKAYGMITRNLIQNEREISDRN